MCGIKVCEEQKQNMEDTMLELLEVYRQKELYCMHNNVDDLIESALNSKLLSVILKSQRLDKEKQKVKNILEEPTKYLPTKEPKYSLSTGDEHLSTILKTKSDKVIKSSVKNLVPIPSESEVTSDNESECDVPVKDESSPIFTTFPNPLFDCNDDFTSSDDESLSNKDVPKENFKIYSSPLFDDEEIISRVLCELAHIDPIPPGIEEVDFDLEEEIRLVENFLYDNSSPRLSEEFNAEITDTIVESLHLLSPENDDYDSEGDIHILEELLSNDTPPLPKNESSNFDHHDDPSFSRPPPEPSNVEIFFDFEPDTGVLTAKVVEDISEHHVLIPKVLPTQPALCLNIDPLLQFSSENEDKVFKPGILSCFLVSHRDKTTSDFSKNPMMMYGGDIPILDVLYLYFYPP
nr:hypothetical protein [Tanacetum cinerariifolium]